MRIDVDVKRLLLALVGCLAIVSCGQGDRDEPTPSGVADEVGAAAGARPAAFNTCLTCHSIEPGRSGLGPSLHGVVGRAAGSVAGYAYSPAMKSSGITWTDETLGSFLEAPQKAMPGTKMAYAGMKDAQKRSEIIAYLNSLK